MYEDRKVDFERADVRHHFVSTSGKEVRVLAGEGGQYAICSDENVVLICTSDVDAYRAVCIAHVLYDEDVARTRALQSVYWRQLTDAPAAQVVAFGH